MSDEELTSLDRWVGELQKTILDRAASNLETIKDIGEGNTKIAVEYMGRMQQLLIEQERITAELSGLSEDVGTQAAANAGQVANLVQAQMDAVNVAGSVATILKNLDFFMNENPELAGQLAGGLAGVPAQLARALIHLKNEDLHTWYDCIRHEAKRRRSKLA